MRKPKKKLRMMRKKPLSPKEALARVRRKYEGQHDVWLLQEADMPEAWPMVIALGVPGERDAMAAPAELRAWVLEWRQWEGAGSDVQIVWERRAWPRLGEQELPVRLEIRRAAAVARLCGQGTRWARAQQRYQELCARWPVLVNAKLMSRFYDVWADYSQEDFDRLVRLLGWLMGHPDSGHYLRQLPVEGLDTKWVESRRALIHDLVQWLQVRTADDMRGGGGRDFYAVCGLRTRPKRLRIRLLCPALRSRVGGLGDIEATVEDLAALGLAPRVVLISENLETALALPDLPGTVALMSLGYSVDLLEQVPWIRSAALQLYWGDLDTHGFAILNRARKVLPQVKSVLMDEATLRENLKLCGKEATPHAGEEFAFLHPAELAVYQGLKRHSWGESLRLEQERLPWTLCMDAIRAELA